MIVRNIDFSRAAGLAQWFAEKSDDDKAANLGRAYMHLASLIGVHGTGGDVLVVFKDGAFRKMSEGDAYYTAQNDPDWLVSIPL